MKRKDEIANPGSCLNTAKDDDWVFVLIQKDIAAPNTIRFWVKERIRLGKNKEGDYQLVRALEIADIMEAKQNG